MVGRGFRVQGGQGGPRGANEGPGGQGSGGQGARGPGGQGDARLTKVKSELLTYVFGGLLIPLLIWTILGGSICRARLGKFHVVGGGSRTSRGMRSLNTRGIPQDFATNDLSLEILRE